MTPLAIALFALAAFAAGLHFGRRRAERQARQQLTCLEQRYQKIVDFADDYIGRTAPHRGLHVIRNDSGRIVELAMRCGTGFFALQDLMQAREQLKDLH